MVEVLEADDAGLKRAAKILEEGGVVAFPTETVYGLGCDATNEKAIVRVYEIKGRRYDKPFIVGVLKDWVERFAEVDELAKKLIDKFFPGPLTVVLKSRGVLPEILSPEGKIALRMPSHAIPLKLMELLKRPIIVPSANISSRPSIVKWEQVILELGEKIDAVVKGECGIGVESTIVDLTLRPARVLRRGAISVEELKNYVDLVVEEREERYSVSSPVYVFVGDNAEKRVREFAEAMRREGKKVVVLARRKIDSEALVLGEKIEEYALKLFSAVREAEAMRPDVIVIEGIEGHEGLMDRLKKLAGDRFFR